MITKIMEFDDYVVIMEDGKDYVCDNNPGVMGGEILIAEFHPRGNHRKTLLTECLKMRKHAHGHISHSHQNWMKREHGRYMQISWTVCECSRTSDQKIKRADCISNLVYQAPTFWRVS